MKRRISHGQAMRSIFGRSRVIQREPPGTRQSGRFTIVGSPAATPRSRLRGEALLARAESSARGLLAHLVAVHAVGDQRPACGVRTGERDEIARRAQRGRDPSIVPSNAASRRTSTTSGPRGEPSRSEGCGNRSRRCPWSLRKSGGSRSWTDTVLAVGAASGASIHPFRPRVSPCVRRARPSTMLKSMTPLGDPVNAIFRS